MARAHAAELAGYAAGLLAAAASVLAGGCSALAGQDDSPAVIVAPTTQSRAELTSVVSRALNGRSVRLADDALTHDGGLVIERAQPRDPSGIPYDGRQTQTPDQFQLVKHGSHCVLVYLRTGQRFTLHQTRCEPVAPGAR